jgi:hypothetical protein
MEGLAQIILVVAAVCGAAGFLSVDAGTSPGLSAGLKAAGALAFGGSLVLAIRQTADRLAGIAKTQGELYAGFQELKGGMRTLEGKVEAFEAEEKYGHKVVQLMELQRNGSSMHDRLVKTLGGQILKSALMLPGMVDSIQEYANASVSLRLKENYLISDILHSLLAELPPHCIWLGVTHLGAGWASGADEIFARFSDRVNELASRGDLTVFRLYSLPDNELHQLSGTLRQHRDAGIIGRAASNSCPDISLIWGPARDEQIRTIREGQDDPVSVLIGRDIKPICGMRFEVTGGVLLRTVEVISPDDANSFSRMRDEFSSYWRAGHTLEL